jgi:hypothetical protein
MNTKGKSSDLLVDLKAEFDKAIETAGESFRVPVLAEPSPQREDMPVVTPDDGGIRPAGAPDRCLYCRSRVGEKHKNDCITVVKKVRLRATVEYEVEVPHGWDKDAVEFRYNESTWCADNLVDELQAYVDEMRKGDRRCLCSSTEVEYLGTVDDTPRRSRS